MYILSCGKGFYWRRREGALRTSMLFLLVFICSCTRESQEANAPRITVPAKPTDWRVDVLTDTEIPVEPGSTLVLRASGSWSVGTGVVGPEGKENWCECVVRRPVGSGFRGPLGAVIGRIGRQGKPFLVGTHTEVTTGEGGTLFLGANDNMGPCDQMQRGSCYADNFGSVTVTVAQTSTVQTLDQPNALFGAVERRDYDIVKDLLDHGADVNAHGPWGATALTKACRTGDLKIVALLLNRDAEVNAVETEAGSVATFHYGVPTVTPLVLGIEAEDVDLVLLLLEHGADPNLEVSRRESSGFRDMAPVDIARRRGNLKIYRLLQRAKLEERKAR